MPSLHCVSILPRLATGILCGFVRAPDMSVSILPRLATGIGYAKPFSCAWWFLFFPVLRRGSPTVLTKQEVEEFLFFPVLRRGSPPPQHVRCRHVSILPRLATGILLKSFIIKTIRVSILPRLATGIVINGDHIRSMRFLFFPVLRRGSH